jgi:hypothetical protein
VTGYRLDDQIIRIQFLMGGWEFFSSTPRPVSIWGPRALSLGVRLPVGETDHSLPSSAKVKEYVELYLYSPICLHGVVLS